ncbi:hypothetical protein ACFQE1_08395 [Halobium palmae]|uniref:Uncharacterized protein n=1 Tax=Halobium palmae TaxID=1776492 RepID=A0ABD5RYX6_9EURY
MATALILPDVSLTPRTMETTATPGRHAALSEFEASFASDEAVLRDDEWSGMRVASETYREEFDDAAPLKRPRTTVARSDGG